MKSRRIPVIIGLLLALGTGVLLLNYLSSVRAGTPVAQTKTVLVAARDISARALIPSEAVTTAQKSINDLDSDAIVDKKFAVGKYSLITIPAGGVLTSSKVGSLAAFALPARLPVGMRAVSIAIDRVKGVSGLIQPGDRVDVIAVPPRAGNETPLGSAILRGALVLAMGNETETARATPSPTNQDLTTVTLAVTPGQADVLASADINTVLRLALRSPKESIRAYAAEPLRLGIPEHQAAPVQVQAQIPVAAPAAPPAIAVAAPVPAPARQLQNNVLLIDGDRLVRGTGQTQ